MGKIEMDGWTDIQFKRILHFLDTCADARVYSARKNIIRTFTQPRVE